MIGQVMSHVMRRALPPKVSCESCRRAHLCYQVVHPRTPGTHVASLACLQAHHHAWTDVAGIQMFRSGSWSSLTSTQPALPLSAQTSAWSSATWSGMRMSVSALFLGSSAWTPAAVQSGQLGAPSVKNAPNLAPRSMRPCAPGARALPTEGTFLLDVHFTKVTAQLWISHYQGPI